MKKLPVYAKSLLLHGASTLGNFTDGYSFVEESLQINHANELFKFCKWVDENIGGASAYNIDMLFSAFKNPENQELRQQATVLANRIQSIRRM